MLQFQEVSFFARGWRHIFVALLNYRLSKDSKRSKVLVKKKGKL